MKRKCPVCGRMIGLTRNYRFRKHGNRDNPCDGSWRYETWVPQKPTTQKEAKL